MTRIVAAKRGSMGTFVGANLYICCTLDLVCMLNCTTTLPNLPVYVYYVMMILIYMFSMCHRTETAGYKLRNKIS